MAKNILLLTIFFTTEVYRRVRRGQEYKPSGLHCRGHGFLLYVANAEVICKKLFKIFSKVLCGILPARFRRFYRKIALLFSSKNDENLRGSLSQMF